MADKERWEWPLAFLLYRKLKKFPIQQLQGVWGIAGNPSRGYSGVMRREGASRSAIGAKPLWKIVPSVARPILGGIGALAMLSGCATWQTVKPQKTAWRSGDFSADLPAGWARSRTPEFFLYLTHDGPYLQHISLSLAKTGRELPHSKKKITEDMMLQEIAGVMLDELRLNNHYQNFEVWENKPVDLGGVQAFRLVYTFNNAQYAKYRAVRYGFVYRKKYFEIVYQAAEQHHFGTYANAFEEFIASFVVRKAGLRD